MPTSTVMTIASTFGRESRINVEKMGPRSGRSISGDGFVVALKKFPSSLIEVANGRRRVGGTRGIALKFDYGSPANLPFQDLQ